MLIPMCFMIVIFDEDVIGSHCGLDEWMYYFCYIKKIAQKL